MGAPTANQNDYARSWLLFAAGPGRVGSEAGPGRLSELVTVSWPATFASGDNKKGGGATQKGAQSKVALRRRQIEVRKTRKGFQRGPKSLQTVRPNRFSSLAGPLRASVCSAPLSSSSPSLVGKVYSKLHLAGPSDGCSSLRADDGQVSVNRRPLLLSSAPRHPPTGRDFIWDPIAGRELQLATATTTTGEIMIASAHLFQLSALELISPLLGPIGSVPATLGGAPSACCLFAARRPPPGAGQVSPREHFQAAHLNFHSMAFEFRLRLAPGGGTGLAEWRGPQWGRGGEHFRRRDLGRGDDLIDGRPLDPDGSLAPSIMDFTLLPVQTRNGPRGQSVAGDKCRWGHL